MKKTFFKNFSYVFVANSACILMNAAVNFLVPALFSQEAYSYYQLENLYCGYLWILTLGWHEGFYIYYGGKTEEKMDLGEIRSQFWLFFLYMVVMSFLAVGIGGIIFFDETKKYVFGMSMISVALEAVRCIFLYYLLCIDKMKRYSAYMVADRIVYIAFLLVLLLSGCKDYSYLIGADILSKAVLLACILWMNRSVLFHRVYTVKETFRHTKTMVASGINVAVASFVSRFINGTVRLAIESVWGILVFGKISLTLSVSNMFTQFIQAVSVILFPALRRTTEQKQRQLYAIISDLLDICMFCVFLFYLPGVRVLGFLLPQYRDGLQYMAILFPVCLYDARNMILDNTYLKALHKEKGILVSNLVAVCFSLVFSGITVFWLHNLNFAVFSMVLLTAIRCACSEWVLKKELHQNMMQSFAEESVMTFVFIMANWTVSGIGGTLIYACTLCFYIAINRRRILEAVGYLWKRV